MNKNIVWSLPWQRYPCQQYTYTTVMRSVHWFHKKYRHYSDFILLLYNVLEYNTLYYIVLFTLLTLDTAPSHVKMCRWLTSYVPPPPLSISSIVVSLWLAGCLAKSTLIGWREYYGGGGVGVDRHLCGAQQTRGFDPMLFHYWPTNIETTSGQGFVFGGRAVRIMIHAGRLCLVGTGSAQCSV